METFERFTYECRGAINKELVYYGLSYEEKIQECALVYFSDEEIRKLFVSGDKRKAFSKFKVQLRKSAKKFSKTGIRIRDAVSYDRSLEAEMKVSDSFEIQEASSEEEVLKAIDFDNVKDIIDKDTLDLILFYYDNGGEMTSMKYGISQSAVGVRVHRAINKIKGVL